MSEHVTAGPLLNKIRKHYTLDQSYRISENLKNIALSSLPFSNRVTVACRTTRRLGKRYLPVSQFFHLISTKYTKGHSSFVHKRRQLQAHSRLTFTVGEFTRPSTVASTSSEHVPDDSVTFITCVRNLTTDSEVITRSTTVCRDAGIAACSFSAKERKS